MQHRKSYYQRPQNNQQSYQRCSIKRMNSPSPFCSSEGAQSESQDLFELEYHTMKKLRLPIHRKISKGAWNLQQNKAYLDFLIKNKESFTSESLRRESRVFCRLSEILHKKRTPDQCRGHHQKLIGKEEQSVDILIDKLAMKIAQSEKQKKLKIKTRLIGKYQKNKSNKGQKQGIKKDDDCQILRVDKKSFCKITTFKNSNQILLQIEQDAIEAYSFI